MYKNLFAKSNLSGDFVILNPFLVADLKRIGSWSRRLAETIKAHDGDLTEIEEIPAEIKERYRTAFQIDARWLIDAAALRLDPTQQLAAALGARLSQTTDDRLLSADAAAGCARLRPRQRRRGSQRPRSRTRAGCCRRRC